MQVYKLLHLSRKARILRDCFLKFGSITMSVGRIGEVRKTSNGCKVAERVQRQTVGFRIPSQCIAAIDFGTTSCSVAYLLDDSVEVQRLILNDTFYRVPTAILFNADGKVASFGIDAQQDYKNLDDEKRLQCIYFEHFKMRLQNDEEVNRDMTIKSSNDKLYYLVDVIAHVLCYLKGELIEQLTEAGYELKATNFDWVITVPAIWRARGKQMMREAGYKAGLCSELSGTYLASFQNLVPATHARAQPFAERNPDKLLLALEPESAVLYCRRSLHKVSAHSPDKLDLSQYHSRTYMVVDIGGGTVDISTYNLVDMASTEHIEVIRSPTGNPHGGMEVNMNFRRFLEKLVEDSEFEAYINGPDQQSNVAHRAALNELVNNTFEVQKKCITTILSRGGRVSIRLPKSFLDQYHNVLLRNTEKENDVKLIDQELRISSKKMEEFFKSVTDSILECIKEALSDVGGSVDTTYLVGGFGGCKYIHEVVQGCREIMQSCSKLVVPEDAADAVVCGAVMYGINPQTICARRADATYGIAICSPFIEQIHCQEYKFKDDDRQDQCDNLFNTVIEIGDAVNSDEAFKLTYCPVYHNQTCMKIKVYSSLERDVWYVTGKRGKRDRISEPVKVYNIGNLTVSMPNLAGDKQRKVHVYFDFTHTEINVKAYDPLSQNEAGLCNGFRFVKLSPVTSGMIKIPLESNPERLSLAHEPESAAIYCQCLNKMKQARFAKVDRVAYDSYMIVDVGGGTVDLSVYRKESVPDEHLNILLPPTGNAYGGALINDNFMHFLEDLVGDKGFLKYIATNDEVVNQRHKAELQQLRNNYFEEQKKLFGKKRTVDNDERKLSVKLPITFLSIYTESLEVGVAEYNTTQLQSSTELQKEGAHVEKAGKNLQLELADGNLRITYRKMEDFFLPVVDGIIKSIAEALECIGGCVDAMYLVGGFGGSRYLYDKIMAKFGDCFMYIVPLMSDVAVVEGAVWHHKNPQILHSRLADSTYGIRVSLPFDASKHAIEHKRSTDDDDENICENLFSPIVIRGDTINTSEVFKSTHYPESINQKQMNIELYSSQQLDVKYTTEESVKKIGELIVPLPTPETLPEHFNERQVDIFFDFTYSELQVLAYDHVTKKQVKCVLDFFTSS